MAGESIQSVNLAENGCAHGPVKCQLCLKVQTYRRLILEGKSDEVRSDLIASGFETVEQQDAIIEFVQTVTL